MKEIMGMQVNITQGRMELQTETYADINTRTY